MTSCVVSANDHEMFFLSFLCTLLKNHEELFLLHSRRDARLTHYGQVLENYSFPINDNYAACSFVMHEERLARIE